LAEQAATMLLNTGVAVQSGLPGLPTQSCGLPGLPSLGATLGFI